MNAPALSILSGGWNEPTNQPQPAIPAALAQPCWLLIPQVLLGILRFVCSWIHIGKCIMAWVAELLDMVFPTTTLINTTFKWNYITQHQKTRAPWRVSFRRLGVKVHEVHETPLVLKAGILEPNGSKIKTFVIVYTCNPPWQISIATTLPKTQTQGKATKKNCPCFTNKLF